MKTLQLQEIMDCVQLPNIITMQEQGFQALSQGRVDVPAPGYLQQHNPPGSYHIKYGLIEDDKFWVVKIAGGPNHMPENGMMMAISIATGDPVFLLEDHGYLTKLRTAVAGLIAAKQLANKDITCIGIIGTGEQARLQLEILTEWTSCKDVFVWGRSTDKVSAYQKDMETKGFNVNIADNIERLARNCNLIITTTASKEPLLKSCLVQPGTHITAVGADAPGKIELDPKLVAKCDIIVVDSKSQCIDHGEIKQAYIQKLISDDRIIELGEIIENPALGRSTESQITLTDLTGVAVQDIQILKSILKEANLIHI